MSIKVVDVVHDEWIVEFRVRGYLYRELVRRSGEAHLAVDRVVDEAIKEYIVNHDEKSDVEYFSDEVDSMIANLKNRGIEPRFSFTHKPDGSKDLSISVGNVVATEIDGIEGEVRFYGEDRQVIGRLKKNDDES